MQCNTMNALHDCSAMNAMRLIQCDEFNGMNPMKWIQYRECILMKFNANHCNAMTESDMLLKTYIVSKAIL